MTRLCQTTTNEVSFLLMPTWLKYTTVGPSQADSAICKENDAGDQTLQVKLSLNFHTTSTYVQHLSMQGTYFPKCCCKLNSEDNGAELTLNTNYWVVSLPFIILCMAINQLFHVVTVISFNFCSYHLKLEQLYGSNPRLVTN